MKAKDLFDNEVKAEIESAIARSALLTSGELRLFVEDHCADNDVLDRAAYIFEKLEMQRTEQRNGVLFYMAVSDQRFAIIGDRGINSKVPDDFWMHIKDHMATLFKEGRISQGLSEGIAMAGQALSEHFPFKKDDSDELSNEIVIG